MLGRLEAVTPRHGGAYYMARCPAHEDARPSLCVWETEERIAVHCYAGCRHDDVLAAMGLEWHDVVKRDSRRHPRSTPRGASFQSNWRHEALKLCQTDQQRVYVRAMAQDMNARGEWFAGREARARRIPAMSDGRRGGRPSQSGHISLMTLDKIERELVQLGVLAPKPVSTTNGKVISQANGLTIRSRGIKVLRAAPALIELTLRRIGFYFGGGFRRSKSRSSVTRRGRGSSQPDVVNSVQNAFFRFLNRGSPGIERDYDHQERRRRHLRALPYDLGFRDFAFHEAHDRALITSLNDYDAVMASIR